MKQKLMVNLGASGGSGGGTEVIANPTLSGSEAALTGLQVGDTKYSVGGSGGHCYRLSAFDATMASPSSTKKIIYGFWFSTNDNLNGAAFNQELRNAGFNDENKAFCLAIPPFEVKSASQICLGVRVYSGSGNSYIVRAELLSVSNDGFSLTGATYSDIFTFTKIY